MKPEADGHHLDVFASSRTFSREMLVVSIIGRPVRMEGHHFAFHMGVTAACAELGLRHLVFAGSASSKVEFWPENWRHLKILDRPEGPRLWSLAGDLFVWWRAFSKCVQKSEDGLILVFLDSVDGSSLPAISIAASWCLPRIAATFVPIFRMRGFMSRGFRLIARPLPLLWPKVKYKMSTDSDLIVDSLRRNYGVTATWLPNPHIVGRGKATSGAMEPTLPFRLWFPGDPREDKGRRVVDRLVVALKDHDFGYILVAERQCLGDMPANNRTVALDGPFPPQEFQLIMESADAVFLPYDAVRYREATSVILVEAVCAGKIPFVTRGSWLAAQLVRFGLDELAFTWSEPNVFEQFAHLYMSPNVRTKLSRMAAQLEREHGPVAFAAALSKLVSKSLN